MRQPYPQSLGNQSKVRAVGVETPRPTFPDRLQAGLVVPIDEPVGDVARGCSVGQLDRVRAEPLRRDNGDIAVRSDPAHDGADRQVLKAHRDGALPASP